MEKKRIPYLDYIRAFAVLCVCISHSNNRAFLNIPMNGDVINSIIRSIFHFIGKMGVPLFLMLTGSLIFQKKLDTSEDAVKFYRRNLLPLVIATIIWNFAFSWYRSIFYDHLDGGVLKHFINSITGLFFINSNTMNSMWYMPMIICVYLLAPYLFIALNRFKPALIVSVLGLTMMTWMIIPNINEIVGSKIISFEFKTEYLFSYYIAYVIIGYYIFNMTLDKWCGDSLKRKMLIHLLGLSSVVVCIIFQFNKYMSGDMYEINYDFFPVFCSSSYLYYIANQYLRKLKDNRLIAKVSKYSFGIYIIHIVIVSSLATVLRRFHPNPSILLAILALTSFFVSLILVEIISKNRKLAKILFLVKD